MIIPKANAGDLMLRPDVVEACAAGRFHVWAVSTLQEALEIFTGVPAGDLGDDGVYGGLAAGARTGQGPRVLGAVAHLAAGPRAGAARLAETD